MALSLWQPWATLVAIRAKRYETRNWPPPAQILPGLGPHEPMAIHAAKYFPGRHRALCVQEPFKSALRAAGYHYADALPLGAIVAMARTVSGHRTEALLADGLISSQEFAFGNYGPDRYGWALGDVRALTRVIACAGRQRLWRVPDDVERLVRLELAA